MDSGTTTFHLRALSTAEFDQWLNCIREKRADTAVWEEHDARSAISSECFQIDHNQVILKALNDLDVELKSLSALVSKEFSQEPLFLGSPVSDVSTSTPPPLQHSSSSSIKLRFPFKRGASYTSTLDEYQPKSSNPAASFVLEKVSKSVKLMTDYREQLASAYNQSVNMLDVPGRTGTGFTSHRSGSFYSNGGISDTFFDAEDFSISGEEEEEEYEILGVGDSEDEGLVYTFLFLFFHLCFFF